MYLSWRNASAYWIDVLINGYEKFYGTGPGWSKTQCHDYFDELLTSFLSFQLSFMTLEKKASWYQKNIVQIYAKYPKIILIFQMYQF